MLLNQSNTRHQNDGAANSLRKEIKKLLNKPDSLMQRAENGKLIISFGVSCEKCGFSWQYKHEEKLPYDE